MAQSFIEILAVVAEKEFLKSMVPIFIEKLEEKGAVQAGMRMKKMKINIELLA